MNATEWAGFAVAIMTLVVGFSAFVRWLVQHYLSELKPNGGSSMRDAVNVNSARLERLEERVDRIYELLCNK
jgi:hypothetical protein